MKKEFLKLGRCILSFALIGAVMSCENLGDKLSPDDDEPNEGEYNITISDVVPSFKSVTFSIDAPDALAIAYIALPVGEQTTAEYIFENGVARGESSGTYTYSNLESETDYILYAASKSAAGNQGPVTAEFTTLVNSGEPATSMSAGIRVESIDASSLVFELTNGSDVDFSLVMVQPTIIIDNYAYEASKEGLSKDSAIKEFMLTEGNGYLSKQTEGAGTTATYNYDEICSVATALYPDANYTIYSLGCTGDFDDVTSIGIGDLTMINVTTSAIERTGDPQLELNCLSAGYTMIKHEIVPNADCVYWGTYFATEAEFTEFMEYYDNLEGEGAGRKRLREFLLHADPYVTDEELVESTEVTISLSTDYVGIPFTRLALAFDGNRVAADDFEDDTQELIPIDDTIPDAEYDMEVNGVGAGDLYINTTLYGNCAMAYWRIVNVDTFDAYFETEESKEELAWLLFDEGWAEFRESGSNPNQDEILERETLYYGLETGVTLQLISTGLNYDAGLSEPQIVSTFTTLERTKGDYEPAVSLDIEVGRTNALVTYTADADAREKDARLLYHRILAAESEEVLAHPDIDDMYDYLTSDDCYEFNVWTVINSDTTDDTPYEYSFNWSSMESGTEYIYYYMTINGEGVCSTLKAEHFTTLTNEGGANPALTITIDPESIRANENYPSLYGGSGSITPNDDVIEFKYAFIDETVIKSYWSDPDVLEELQLELYSQLISQGITSTEKAYNEGYTFSNKDRVWLMAQGQGANGVESPLSYVEMRSDGTVLEQVDVDISQFTSSSVAPSNVKSAAYNATKVSRGFNGPQFDKNTLLAKSSVYHIEKRASKMTTKSTTVNGAELRAAGIPYYSFKEMTLKTLRRGVELE